MAKQNRLKEVCFVIGFLFFEKNLTMFLKYVKLLNVIRKSVCESESNFRFGEIFKMYEDKID